MVCGGGACQAAQDVDNHVLPNNIFENNFHFFFLSFLLRSYELLWTLVRRKARHSFTGKSLLQHWIETLP